MTKGVACSCGSGELGPRVRPFTWRGRSLALRRCGGCGRFLLDPRPSFEELAAAYDSAYYGTGERKFLPWLERVRDAFRDARGREVERSLARPGRMRVLDIGCGEGEFLAGLIRRGHEGHGTEFSGATAVRAARVPGLILRTGELGPESYPPGAFDAISIWHVLEHLPDPDQTLRHSRRWIAPAGVLLVAVPNADSWQARLFRGSWFHLDPPRHLHHFGRRSLRSALERAGFRIERLETLSWEQNVYGVLQSALNAIGFPRDEFYEVLKGNQRATSPRLLLEGGILAILAPAAALFTVAEAAFGQGGTLHVTARPSEQPYP